MRGLKRSVRQMESSFSSQLDRRDTLLKESRDVISSCSRAIISVHGGKLREAEAELAAAGKLLSKLKKAGAGSLARYLVSPEAEYVEASAVVSLSKGREIPPIGSLGASPEAYLLGLLDTVGELKRLVLDSLMRNRLAKAKRYFAVMEDIYSACSPLAVYDHVANGARRKIDVARILIEDTRGVLAEEARREAANAAMAHLEKRLDASRA